jgi:vacuolar-type H+-ATPase subunit H
MDMLQLIDRLEQLVTAGTRLPLSSRTMIDEQEFLDIIDQLRVTVPEEIRHARRVSQDRDRFREQAEAEAEKIMADAQATATKMLEESEVVRQAHQREEKLIAEAEQYAAQLRADAENYALEVLGGLESELTKLLVTVRKGRATLDRNSQSGRSSNGAASSE